jgi:glycosyltransferase involved in cell wall biosynthesis
MDRVAQRLVFITENERDNVRKLGAKTIGDVIYNPINKLNQLPKKHKFLSSDSRFKVCCLSNYKWVRGIDRLIEIAEVLKIQENNDVLFVVAGDISISEKLPGDLGLIGRRNGDLSDYAELKGVSDMFLFLGYVDDPECVLFACDVLAKPTRESNPWGRDIIESMAMEKPVISIGAYDGFVKNNVTGYLLPIYNVMEFAQRISDLIRSPDKCRQMGLKARQIVETKCNGSKSDRELTEVWIKASRFRIKFELNQ